MSNTNELFIDHEVRIRLLEENVKETKEMRKEMHDQFKWIIGTLLGLFVAIITMFGSAILAKLI